MYVIIQFAVYEDCMEEGYEPYCTESVFTQPFRVKQDVYNAYQSVQERLMMTRPDLKVGIITFEIEATPDDLNKIARSVVGEGLFPRSAELKKLERHSA